MIIFSNFLIAIAKVLDIVLTIFMWIVIARAVLSWVSPDPYNPIVRFIHQIPVIFGGIDFSPILVFLAIIFLQRFVVSSLLQMAQTLQ